MDNVHVDPLINQPVGLSREPTAPVGWSVVGVTVLFAALLTAIYAGILVDLGWQWWDDENYSHGFVVPLFSAFLVWQRRAALWAAPWHGSWWGLALMIAGLAELVLGQVAAENFLLRSSLVVILAGLVWFHCGGYVLRLLAFPLGFLLFMIPIPATIFYAVAFPLQRFAAANAAAVLDLLGIPVLLDGNVMHLSTISLGVTEACSGIRSLISLLALAVAWAYLTLPGIGSMALLIAAAIPITIVANVGRVVTTGLTAEWFGARYAEGFFHSFSGWLIFLIAFGGLFAVHTGIGLARRLLRKWR